MDGKYKLLIGGLVVTVVVLAGALVSRRPVSADDREVVAVAATRNQATTTTTRTRSEPAPPADDRSWLARVVDRKEQVTVPAGTEVSVRLASALSSHELRAGDSVEVTLGRDLVVDGKRVAGAGARGLAEVIAIDHSDRVEGREEMSLGLVELELGGSTQRVESDPVHLTAQGTKKRDAAVIGGSAAVGALIGAIAGGGDGAAKGAVIGGAGGTGVVLSTKGEDIDLPAGHGLAFRLAQPIRVEVDARDSSPDVSRR